MKLDSDIAFFNSNSGTNYLCFGEGDKLIFNTKTDFNSLQSFLNNNKGKFIYGYISYDVKNDLEKLVSQNNDNLNFPLIYFHTPKNVIEFNSNQQTFIQGEYSIENQQMIDLFLKELNFDSLEKINQFQARISKSEYIEKVNQLKEHIQRGDIYEINFCQEYYAENVNIDSPIQLYNAINNATQAPFSVFLKHDEFSVFCGSPERFIQKKGSKISSQPIKGTAKRGQSEEEDLQLKKKLSTDPKEISENVMIVDLVRNDLSKIAKKGSVKVDELFGIHTYKTVHQMISTISCEIDDDINFINILNATFPMGSMTGAPKVNAMRLSEQHESFKRGLYSGSIGYILPNGDFDFNVVIRSLLHNAKTKYLSCSVGGAITINSDAEKEYEECQTKINKLLTVFTN